MDATTGAASMNEMELRYVKRGEAVDKDSARIVKVLQYRMFGTSEWQDVPTKEEWEE